MDAYNAGLDDNYELFLEIRSKTLVDAAKLPANLEDVPEVAMTEDESEDVAMNSVVPAELEYNYDGVFDGDNIDED